MAMSRNLQHDLALASAALNLFSEIRRLQADVKELREDVVSMNVEPHIQIGDHVLTEAQAKVVRYACIAFEIKTGRAEGREEYGPVADEYNARMCEVIEVMKAAARREVQPDG